MPQGVFAPLPSVLEAPRVEAVVSRRLPQVCVWCVSRGAAVHGEHGNADSPDCSGSPFQKRDASRSR